MYSSELRVEKKEAEKIAKELGYSEETIDKIKNANSSYDISRALMAARRKGE